MATNFGYNTLKTTGTVGDSLNYIFVAEGFVSNEMGVFNSKCTELMNYILAQSPFKENGGIFNFYSIDVVSPASGITHPFSCGIQCSSVIPAMPQKFVNSYFGLSFDCDNLHRFVLPTNTQVNLIMDTIKASIPFYNPNHSNFEPIVICNDSGYGGSEQGSIATTTLNSLSNEVLMHEMGHSIAACNDEYIGGQVMRAWNTDTTNDPKAVEWKALIPPAGVVQVGSEQLWKGYATCKMNTLGVPFCLVCATQLAKSFGLLITKAGGTPTVPVVYPPIPTTPPIPPSGVDTSNSGGLSLAMRPVHGKVLLQCAAIPNANIYVMNIYEQTGKAKVVPYQTVNAPNKLIDFKNLNAGTYLATVYGVLPNGTHTIESTFFKFTTP